MTGTAEPGSVQEYACPSCGTPLREGARFCGHCGAPLTATGGLGSGRRRRRAVVALAVLTVGAAAALAVASLLLVRHEQQARRHDSASLRGALVTAQHRLTVLERQNGVLAQRLVAAEKNAEASGVAPLAARILRSVFTIETPNGLGSGWAAWNAGGATYVITAYHVVADALAGGGRDVTVRQKSNQWRGRIGAVDDANDLAVVRVAGEIAPPLWQAPDSSLSPLPGDQLVLVGSPYGLEGTVTTGVISRVTWNVVQTDAAANPGNSGGPAVDAKGEVVGILVSGSGENLNFIVPIQRACVVLRHC
ncbi:MAG TPA: trypsin-like peptidase domain-containing protein [Gaiellaceae bacterium]|nr:trypsin-like peptidase domain-containing protein [Gaiellaceae bacterium]